MSSNQVHAAIVMFTGFTQGAFAPTAGFEALYARLENTFFDRRRVLLMRRPWDTWKDADDRVAKASPEKVVAIGYSYGGWSLCKFARELPLAPTADRQVRVTHAMLVDPVHRYTHPIKWLSLLRGRTMNVPGNLERISIWRQVNNTPMGHKIALEDKATQSITQELVYGSIKHLNKRPEFSEGAAVKSHIVHPTITHNLIDNEPSLHASILARCLHEVQPIAEALKEPTP